MKNLKDIQKEAIKKLKKDYLPISDWQQVDKLSLEEFIKETIKSSILAAFEATEVGDWDCRPYCDLAPRYCEIVKEKNQTNAQRRKKQREFLNETP